MAWTDDTHYTDKRGNVWTTALVGGANQTTSPAYPGVVVATAVSDDIADNKGGLTSKIDTFVASPASVSQPSLTPTTTSRWKAFGQTYGIPGAIGIVAAGITGFPLLIGAAVGAGGYWAYRKWWRKS